MKDKLIAWQDGHYVALKNANINVLTHSLHYGIGAYEGVRCYQTEKGPVIFRLQDHTKRFNQSAHILNMTMPFDSKVLNEVQQEIIRQNSLGDAYIRPLIYCESDNYISLRAKNIRDRVFVIAFPWVNYMTDEQYRAGIRIKTSSFQRYHPNSILTKAKSTGKYLSTVLALKEVGQSNVDDAIFLDSQGFVSEGTGTNVFMVRDEVLYTPETTSALEGITRDTVMTFARDAGYTVVEKRFPRDELYIADEVFFTGSAAGIVGINEVDGRTISNGRSGPMTEWLRAQYHQCIHGQLSQYSHWLTYIDKQEDHENGNSCRKESIKSSSV